MKVLLQLAITCFCVILYSLALQFGQEKNVALILSVILILSVGIPHGATDHLLYNAIVKKEYSLRPDLTFTFRYMSIMMVYALIWFYFPFLSLIVFLLISAFHFGETQWMANEQNDGSLLKARVIHFAWGASLLGVLFMLHPVAFRYYLDGLLSIVQLDAIQNNILVITLATSVIWLFTAFWFTTMSMVLKQMLIFGFLTTVFYLTDLILGFSLFFAVWHSTDAIVLQVDRLNHLFGNFNLAGFAKASLPFTLISIFGLGFIMSLLWFLSLDIPAFTWLLILISLLTLPHQLHVSFFYAKTKAAVHS